jgi:hypothetical protein
MVLKVEEDVCLVLKFKQKKQTFAKIERENIDFFLIKKKKKKAPTNTRPDRSIHLTYFGPAHLKALNRAPTKQNDVAREPIISLKTLELQFPCSQCIRPARAASHTSRPPARHGRRRHG